MATRLGSPYPLVWSTGLARAGVGCQGPCPILADLILADPASRGSRVRLQLNPTRITPAPIMLPRLDALDADAIE